MDFELDKLEPDNDMTIRTEIIPLVTKEDEAFLLHEDTLASRIPVLPIRNNVLFPGVVSPISIGRKKSLELIRECEKSDSRLVATTQLRDEENPGPDDIFNIGVVVRVIRVIDLPNNEHVAVLQATQKCSISEVMEVDGRLSAAVSLIDEGEGHLVARIFHNVIMGLRKRFSELQHKRMNSEGPSVKDILNSLKNIQSDRIFLNYVAQHLDVSCTEKQHMLEAPNYAARLELVNDFINDMESYYRVCQDVERKTRREMDRQQREFYLNQQMRVIQDELGGSNPIDRDIDNFVLQADEKDLPLEALKAFNSSIAKLRRTPPQTPDYTVELNYVELLLSLPWGECSKDDLSTSRAQKVLEKDHFGLEKVKQRIVEYIAVLRLKGDMKSPILCFVGPPGTGKTSLGKSIATAMKRKYVRVALGGLHDEAEIRGHRKTYVGAMPGRIIQNIKKAGVNNPVFVLDEIDKVQGMSNHGDPTSALLEVLDPEQNNAFHDNYLDLDYDLSKVLFIATANSLSSIQPALLDRMEIIDLSGYILEEKLEIAKRHLIPRQLQDHGLDKKSLKFDAQVLSTLVNDYTRESGVRQLDKAIAKIVRSRAVQVADGKEIDKRVHISELKDILGLPIHQSDRRCDSAQVGVVTGLAWTQVGGEILFVESSLSKGKGTLTMTGNLGDVMKESATLAFEYIKANAQQFGIDYDKIENSNIHIHVPEGATPKDGPSAGITMFVCMVSSFTQRKVRSEVAMTGEITLRGSVTPVGGIREKILAAKRAGITTLILCEDNRRDIEDIPEQYRLGLSFHYIREMKEALPIALES